LAVVDGVVAGELVGQVEHPEDYLHGYAVSNRHVVKKHPVVRLNKQDGTTDVLPFTQEDWFFTDDQDIAVVPLPDSDAYKWLFISVASKFLTKELAAKADVGIGDEVFMVGRFMGHDGRQRNDPTIRWGHVAAIPSEFVHHPSNRPGEQESMLIEVHSISGYSGSPVFVRPMPPGRLRVQPEEHPPPSYAFAGPWLLGIEWGYINTHQQRENNTGISAVVPAWLITKLLNDERLKMQREKEQNERLERRQKGSTTLTSRDEPATGPSRGRE
jgi:hypothetical protein